MNAKTRLVVGISCVGMLGLIAGGCRDGADQSETPGAGGSADAAVALAPDLFLEEAPPDAQDLETVKGGAAVGDDVVIRGRIGGRVEPFVQGRAIFMLADTRMPTCAQRHGDAADIRRLHD